MRVIHVGLRDSADLKRLHQLIVESLTGVHAAEKRFDPHITIGRVKRAIPSEMKDLANLMTPLSTLFRWASQRFLFSTKKKHLDP